MSQEEIPKEPFVSPVSQGSAWSGSIITWEIVLAAVLASVGIAWAGTIFLQKTQPTPVINIPLLSKTTNVGMDARSTSTPVFDAISTQIDDFLITSSTSAEYKRYVSGLDTFKQTWLEMKADLVASGATPEEIKINAQDYAKFFGQTLLLTIELDSKMNEEEKKSVTLRLASVMADKEFALEEKTDCAWIEQKVPLQDLLAGATIKFTKPMLYIDDKQERAQYCSPILSSTKNELYSKKGWDSIIFDKSAVIEKSIDPSVTFTIEGSFRAKRPGLLGSSDIQYYIFRDDKGMIWVAPYFIFDTGCEKGKTCLSDSGSELYHDGKRVGHLVVDDASTFGALVWIEGGEAPKEVIEAHTFKKSTNFDTPIAKKDEFVERVMFAIDEGKLVQYTDQEIITLDLAKDLYTYQGGEIIHDRGGNIHIKRTGEIVSVIYEKIPKEKECFEFYYMNGGGGHGGFNESYIDGMREEEPTQTNGWDYTIVEKFKQKACYSGKETITIEFRGTTTQIKKKAASTREYRKPPEY